MTPFTHRRRYPPICDGINAPVPRIFTSLDNASQAARKRGYMRALTTANIESIFYPASARTARATGSARAAGGAVRARS